MALPLLCRFNKSKGPICMCHTDEFEFITYYLYSNWINHMLAFPAERGPKRRTASAGSHPSSSTASQMRQHAWVPGRPQDLEEDVIRPPSFIAHVPILVAVSGGQRSAVHSAFCHLSVSAAHFFSGVSFRSSSVSCNQPWLPVTQLKTAFLFSVGDFLIIFFIFNIKEASEAGVSPSDAFTSLNTRKLRLRTSRCTAKLVMQSKVLWQAFSNKNRW